MYILSIPIMYTPSKCTINGFRFFILKKYNQNNDLAAWYDDQLQVPIVVVTEIVLISLMIFLN